MRDLTNVEINVIKAIHAETGTKAMIELLIEWASKENGTYVSPVQIRSIEEDEAARVAKLDDQARGVKAQVEAIVRGGLTEREIGMIVNIAESDYMDGDPAGTTWANCICNNRADAALVGSLAKKGFVQCNQFGGKKSEDTIRLTIRGLMAYRESRPESEYARAQAQVEIEGAAAERAHANL